MLFVEFSGCACNWLVPEILTVHSYSVPATYENINVNIVSLLSMYAS